MAQKYDWVKLKAKYVGGSYKNLRAFAEKENVNYDVLRRKASKWQGEKSQASHKKVTKIVTKTIEKIAEKESDRNARHIALLDLILDKTEQVVRDELTIHIDMFGKPHKSPVIKVDKLEAAVRVIEKVQKGQRTALGFDKEIEREKLEIERQKLAIMEAKVGGSGEDIPDDGFLEALEGKGAEIWDGDKPCP